MVAGAERVGMIEYGVAVAAHPMEHECGDRHVIVERSDSVLVAVIDGLGHGAEAAAVAALAVDEVGAWMGEDVDEVVRRCHARLVGTRGVVMSVVAFTYGDVLSWVGVGNVEALLFRAGIAKRRAVDAALLRGGVVGYKLPPLAPTRHRVRHGDLIVLATDGVREDFAQHVDPDLPAQHVADDVMARARTGTDDALVLAARYRGGAP